MHKTSIIFVLFFNYMVIALVDGSIQNDTRAVSKRTFDHRPTECGNKPRPHSVHMEFDDVTIQMFRLRQENAELRESLRLERAETTRLKALTDELGQKLEQREKELREHDTAARTKVREGRDSSFIWPK